MPVSIKEELQQKMEDTREIIEKRFIFIFIKGVEEKLLNINPEPTQNLVFSSLILGAILRYSHDSQEVSLKDFVDKIYETVLKLGN